MRVAATQVCVTVEGLGGLPVAAAEVELGEQLATALVGQAAHRVPVGVQHVEDDQRRRAACGVPAGARRGSSQAGAQPREVRSPRLVETDELTIEQQRSLRGAGGQLLGELGELAGAVAAATRAHGQAAPVDERLGADAVPLDLERPAVLGRGRRGRAQQHRRDKPRHAFPKAHEQTL